jgi:hypothetical protein
MIDLQQSGQGLEGYGMLPRNWSRCWRTSAISSPMPRSFRRFCSTSSMT